MPHKITTKKGFTLIELLVVISIIALLSTIILASLNSARVKARDALRKSEMLELQKALALYYQDNGQYPSSEVGGVRKWFLMSGGQGLNSGSFEIKTNTGSGGYIPNLAPQYIPVLPTDPSGVTIYTAGFMYTSDGENYKILNHKNSGGFEGSNPRQDEAFFDPFRIQYAGGVSVTPIQSFSWMICSGEPACSGW